MNETMNADEENSRGANRFLPVEIVKTKTSEKNEKGKSLLPVGIVKQHDQVC